ncbi:TetR family transcriptional regulator [Actinomadura sp. LD22]|uniref:TetR family transcriptional regulator n=1 Tax=Actinomadura physcomitrii TaxID=2650748 RepID=A0A6I4MFD0_9ACTN|nr:TetR/AcrR family transcriptional regulator [Actinomadura physcomitrii]MWA04918.1 TetR family transcriptional regulator [Actinomadura physcomitrii]
MADPQLAALVSRAVTAQAQESDANRERILDAALAEAAAVGVDRLTVEDVVRRSKLGRMTVYRRFPRREDMLNALVTREVQRFLAAVAAGIDRAAGRREGVAEGFVAAVTFARRHPLLRRASQTDPGSVFEALAVDDSRILSMGAAFIAREIHGDEPGGPSQQVRWVAEVFARLFATYLAIPPADPDPEDDTELRRFAREVLTPMVERAVTPPA